VDLAGRPLFPEIYDHNGGPGILPWQEIRNLVRTGRVSAIQEIPESQIQPASVDLRLGPVAYRVQASFLRGRSATLMTKVRELLHSTIDLTQPTPPVLEPGPVYIIPLLERLKLPDDIQGIANPKSTTGRLDIFTRLISECGDEFDHVPKGYSGELYVEVSSRTFPVRVKTGMKLNQLRFVRGTSARLGSGNLRELAKEHCLLYDTAGPVSEHIGDGVVITVDLEGDERSGIVAYKGKGSNRPVELDKVNYYEPADFWEAILRPENGRIILQAGASTCWLLKSACGCHSITLPRWSHMIPAWANSAYTTPDSSIPVSATATTARFPAQKLCSKSGPTRCRSFWKTITSWEGCIITGWRRFQPESTAHLSARLISSKGSH